MRSMISNMSFVSRNPILFHCTDDAKLLKHVKQEASFKPYESNAHVAANFSNNLTEWSKSCWVTEHSHIKRDIPKQQEKDRKRINEV